MVMLKWANEKDGVNLVARKVTLNGPVPPAAAVLPKGGTWKQKEYDDADFVMEIWALKKQTDPAAVPAATLSKFAVGYLASAGTAAELREMGGPPGGADGASDDGSGEDEHGS
jgi:hypothetical protein